MADAKVCDLCSEFFNEDLTLFEVVVKHGYSQQPDVKAKFEVFQNSYMNPRHLDLDKFCVTKVIRAFMTKLGIKELPTVVLDERYTVQEGGDHLLLNAVTGEESIESIFDQFQGKSIRILVEVL